jgi:hypothetical protein
LSVAVRFWGRVAVSSDKCVSFDGRGTPSAVGTASESVTLMSE